MSSSSSSESDIESDIPRGSVFSVMKPSHIPSVYKEDQISRSKSLASGNTIVSENIVSKHPPADPTFSSYEVIERSLSYEGSENVTTEHMDNDTADLKSSAEEDNNESKLQVELKDTTEANAVDEIVDSKSYSSGAEKSTTDKNEYDNKVSYIAEQSLDDKRYSSNDSFIIISEEQLNENENEETSNNNDNKPSEAAGDIPDGEDRAHVKGEEPVADYRSIASKIPLSNESTKSELDANGKTVDKSNGTDDSKSFVCEELQTVYRSYDTEFTDDTEDKDNALASAVITEAHSEENPRRDTHKESSLSTSEFNEKLNLSILNYDVIDTIDDSQSVQMFNVKPEPTEVMDEDPVSANALKNKADLLGEEGTNVNMEDISTSLVREEEDTESVGATSGGIDIADPERQFEGSVHDESDRSVDGRIYVVDTANKGPGSDKENAVASGGITEAHGEESPRRYTHNDFSLSMSEFNKKMNVIVLNNDAIDTMGDSESMQTFIVKPELTEETKADDPISSNTPENEADLLGEEGTNVNMEDISTSLVREEEDTENVGATSGGIDIADPERQFEGSVHDESDTSVDGQIDVVDTANKGPASGEFVVAHGILESFTDRQQRQKNPQQSKKSNTTNIRSWMEGTRRDPGPKNDTDDKSNGKEQPGAVAAARNDGILTESQTEILHNDGDGLFDIPLDDPEGAKWKNRQKNKEYKRLIKRWNEVDIGSFVYLKYVGLWHAMLVTGAFPGRRVLKGIHYAWPGSGLEKFSTSRTVKEEEFEVNIDKGNLYEVIIPEKLRVGPEEAITRARKLIGETKFNMFTRRSSHVVRECIMK